MKRTWLFCTKVTSKVVPPVSTTITSPPSPSFCAKERPATGAMAGPDFTMKIGRSITSFTFMTPPTDALTRMSPR